MRGQKRSHSIFSNTGYSCVLYPEATLTVAARSTVSPLPLDAATSPVLINLLREVPPLLQNQLPSTIKDSSPLRNTTRFTNSGLGHRHRRLTFRRMTFVSYLIRYRDQALGWRVRASISGMNKRFSSYPKCPELSPNHLHASSAEHTNMWSHTFTSPYVFMEGYTVYTTIQFLPHRGHKSVCVINTNGLMLFRQCLGIVSITRNT